MSGLTALPIDPLLPQVVAALREHGVLVLEASPGAGKTTRVPRALLQSGFAEQGDIVVLQPRRLPTRLAAERVAEELNEPVGQSVGYTVRFEDVGGANTRVRFVTEGVLTRRLLADPQLRGVGTVVLDEFHERHLASDLALGLLRDLRARTRPELNLLVMSATLQADPIAEFLDDAPVLRSEGRRFDVAIEYAERDDDRPLHEQVGAAVRRLLQEGLDGDVLVFLPGAGEIRRASETLQPLAAKHELLVLPLHGDLPLAEQNRAVRPAKQRKVILSTNVAETSVTIDGVVAVVDTGVARVASHSPWSGLPVLKLASISQASAIQRAGRAGRTRAGRALRLYTRHDYEGRRAFDLPETARLDLCEAALALHALGVRRPANWRWFEQPPMAALTAAETLLERLGAVTGEGDLTPTGKAILRYPVHPRLARIMVEANKLHVTDSAAALVAILAERDIRKRARVGFEFGSPRGGEESADVFEVLDLYDQAAAKRFSAEKLRSLDLEPRAIDAVRKAARQLGGSHANDVRDLHARDQALARALLAGFVDRVGKRRGNEVVLAAGGSAAVGAVPAGELLVVLDAQEVQAHKGRGGVRVRQAATIEADWLIDLASDQLIEEDVLQFNPQMERVERISRIKYGAIILDETRKAAPPGPQTSAVLAEAVRAAGGAAFGDPEQLKTLSLRLALLRENFPDLGVPDAAGAASEAGPLQLAALCEGCVSFADLRASDPLASLVASLPSAVQARLPIDVPTKVRLPGGREVKVNYEPDRPPWIESRLQDFFGMAEGPSICRGRVPLVLHLLAPNYRAVQVTRDLANFWRQHYPPLRKELGRRYPRHLWPDDGATAAPPEPKGRR
ncbi:MAG: ATP-dependent helicase HrpB [Deltaproteobacteria bacterium]|nr:ATP-dependent helicase HrpB [Deltaproteobacteria bacterium]